MDKKTYDAAIKKHLAKIDRETGKIFAAFAKEKKAKKIVTLFDENYLWREKYKPRLDKFLKESEEEYRKLWYAYHKPGEKPKSKGIGSVEIGKIYTHKYIPTMTFEVIGFTEKGYKGIQKDSKSLSKLERTKGKNASYTKSEFKELFK